MQPAVQETGKILARIPQAINAAFSSLDIWVANSQYNVEEVKVLLAKKLENVDSYKIVPPEPHIAVPALQAISYSMNSEELRDLYSNLLANSMNSDIKDSIHPCFVEIIKQLSPFEARLLKSLAVNSVLPIIKIRRSSDDSDSSGIDFVKHIIEPKFGITKNNIDTFAVAIDNLIRLNLLSVDYENAYTDKSLYSDILNSQLVLDMRQQITSLSTLNHFIPTYGSLEISYLGELFIEICVI
ncbi:MULTISPECIES: DUF4393 domain-containing protein [unclassified Clostridium]|uniref:DUF4393 domain-containing protein n=1 Tax=unclassified Clostridium TaxID=2614128 RepID=UPI0020794308|nr:MULTISPECIES: DUF4393 domain-containing protein [unclassified Clostridium]